MAQEGQPIEIYCLGTCKRPEGESILPDDRHRGLWEWKFGGYAASLSIDAQEIAYSHMVRMLAKHLKNEVKVIRFPSEPVSAASLKYLELDATSDEAMNVLEDQAYADMNITLSRIGDVSDGEGQLLGKLFATMKEREEC
jgi:hypothetical protein